MEAGFGPLAILPPKVNVSLHDLTIPNQILFHDKRRMQRVPNRNRVLDNE